jgi:hypothetical protein
MRQSPGPIGAEAERDQAKTSRTRRGPLEAAVDCTEDRHHVRGLGAVKDCNEGRRCTGGPYHRSRRLVDMCHIIIRGAHK